MFGLNESVGWHRECAARMIIAVKKKMRLARICCCFCSCHGSVTHNLLKSGLFVELFKSAGMEVKRVGSDLLFPLKRLAKYAIYFFIGCFSPPPEKRMVVNVRFRTLSRFKVLTYRRYKTIHWSIHPLNDGQNVSHLFHTWGTKKLYQGQESCKIWVSFPLSLHSKARSVWILI